MIFATALHVPLFAILALDWSRWTYKTDQSNALAASITATLFFDTIYEGG